MDFCNYGYWIIKKSALLSILRIIKKYKAKPYINTQPSCTWRLWRNVKKFQKQKSQKTKTFRFRFDRYSSDFLFNRFFFFFFNFKYFFPSVQYSLNVQQDHMFLMQKWHFGSLLSVLWWITSTLNSQTLHREAGYSRSRNRRSRLIYKTWIWSITINHLHGVPKRHRVLLHTIAQPTNHSPDNVHHQSPTLPRFIRTIINLWILHHHQTNPC